VYGFLQRANPRKWRFRFFPAETFDGVEKVLVGGALL
jgi:hypothetical protein